MKSLILIFTTLVLLISCGKTKQEVDVENVQTEARSHMNDLPSLDYSDPNLFLGSGFGPAFMSFIKTQNFDLALQFTSKKSIEKYGREVILEKYKSLKTDYKLKKASMSVNGEEVVLRYTTNEFATSKFKDFVVVVENDSCKILLPNNLDDLLK